MWRSGKQHVCARASVLMRVFLEREMDRDCFNKVDRIAPLIKATAAELDKQSSVPGPTW